MIIWDAWLWKSGKETAPASAGHLSWFGEVHRGAGGSAALCSGGGSSLPFAGPTIMGNGSDRRQMVCTPSPGLQGQEPR